MLTLATQIHPTCIPVSGDYQSKLTLMSESLRNDGRIWVPKKVKMLKLYVMDKRQLMICQKIKKIIT